ncbi:MAG: hypothetical protein ABSD28_19400 [Tepidisphaeraceae bacterium]|jgi:hypothetical protein
MPAFLASLHPAPAVSDALTLRFESLRPNLAFAHAPHIPAPRQKLISKKSPLSEKHI